MLPFLSVVLLLLATLFHALLLFLLSLLLALIALGLVFLPPLFAPAAASLGVGKVSRAEECGSYRQRQPDMLKVLHVLFLPFSTDKRREVDASQVSNHYSMTK